MSTAKPYSASSVLQHATLHQVSLYANDVAVSREFYEDVLGAQCLAEFTPPGLAFFKFGDSRLLLDVNGKPGLVYFRVANIEDKVSSLSKLGVIFETDIQAVFQDDDGFFGTPGDIEYMAFFKDPSDNVLALVEQKPTKK